MFKTVLRGSLNLSLVKLQRASDLAEVFRTVARIDGRRDPRIRMAEKLGDLLYGYACLGHVNSGRVP